MNGTYVHTIPTTLTTLENLNVHMCMHAGKSPPEITLNNEGAVDAADLPRESCVVASVDCKIIACTAAMQHCHAYVPCTIPCLWTCFVLCVFTRYPCTCAGRKPKKKK